MTYAQTIAWIKQTAENAGRPGFNAFGVPLHACHGYRHDAHYWAFVRARGQA